jgi:hypothetical protein
MEEANRFLESYLPIYNERFRVIPAGEADLHRPIPRGMRLQRILCRRYRAVPFRHSLNRNERGRGNGKSHALTTSK